MYKTLLINTPFCLVSAEVISFFIRGMLQFLHVRIYEFGLYCNFCDFTPPPHPRLHPAHGFSFEMWADTKEPKLVNNETSFATTLYEILLNGSA
jgi:hypothetical protein